MRRELFLIFYIYPTPAIVYATSRFNSIWCSIYAAFSPLSVFQTTYILYFNYLFDIFFINIIFINTTHLCFTIKFIKKSKRGIEQTTVVNGMLRFTTYLCILIRKMLSILSGRLWKNVEGWKNIPILYLFYHLGCQIIIYRRYEMYQGFFQI